ncbi:defect-in-organelle-trafficking protein DotC [Oxalobacteraceae bacterium GrIS 1.11]
MKRILLAALAGMAVGCAYGADDSRMAMPGVIAAPPDDALNTLDALLNVPSKASTGVNNLRARMIGDAARTVGFRGGMASRARTLTMSLDARMSELDGLFQFATLVRPDGTIPPVIVEATDIASFAPDQFRLAGHAYRIEKEERFVSVPPTWRDYLLAGLSAKEKSELPVPEARPQDDKEMRIWRDAVRSGWEQGEQQADAVLEANFSRLTRDYTGMMLYSPLLAKGMLLPSAVAESIQTVTGDGKQIIFNDTLRRLTARARFETNADKWKPVIAAGERVAKSGKADGTDDASGRRDER